MFFGKYLVLELSLHFLVPFVLADLQIFEEWRENASHPICNLADNSPI